MSPIVNKDVPANLAPLDEIIARFARIIDGGVAREIAKSNLISDLRLYRSIVFLGYRYIIPQQLVTSSRNLWNLKAKIDIDNARDRTLLRV